MWWIESIIEKIAKKKNIYIYIIDIDHRTFDPYTYTSIQVTEW